MKNELKETEKESSLPPINPLERVDLERPPQNLEQWTDYFREHGHRTALRVLVVGISRDRDHASRSDVRPKNMDKVFDGKVYAYISTDKMKRFRDGTGTLTIKEYDSIVKYLWDKKVLQAEVGRRANQRPHRWEKQDQILLNLHKSLSEFFDVSRGSFAELIERAPGRYWIYRPSAYSPGRYTKGYLTIERPADEEKPMTVTEFYRAAGNPAAGEHGFAEEYRGIMLQKGGYPLMLTSLVLPAHQGKSEADRADFDRNSFRITHIARALTHSDGKFASLTGLSSAIYATGGLIASVPVCFERIPAEAAEKALEDIAVVDETQLPPSVAARVHDVQLRQGLIRL